MLYRGRLLHFLFSFLCLLFVAAIQPLKNLQVSCLGRIYALNDVSTVDELVQSLQGGILPSDIKTNRFCIIHKGRILNVGEKLRDVGVLDGSRLVVLPDTSRMKTKEFVALFLAMVSEEGWDRIRRELLEHPEVQNDFCLSWNRAQRLTSHDIHTFLTNGLDRSYHSLRAWWESSNFRSSLTDQEKVEAYRKLILFHLSPGTLNDIPWVKKTIHSRARWRHEVSKVTAFLLRTGDVILDGMRAILLDVLKGNGKGAEMTEKGDYPTRESKFKASTSENLNFDNLLFELSDSDSDV